VVELTYSTPGVLDAVAELASAGMQVGVGTIRTPQQVSDAFEAGATFVVSFHRPVGFLDAAAEVGVLAIPGALTPQEVAAAVDEGAEAIKVFPARLVTPSYLGDLRAVLGPVPLLVTGGIDAQRSAIQPWLDAGAWCVGIGSQLGNVRRDGPDQVSRRVAALC
jgi:2-dehydro-3-deoxyphosphogluconate aldolase/(4S)-4-hydroxy-2-oxoglutarate aldolase